MNTKESSLDELLKEVTNQMKFAGVFDIPEGRHRLIIEEFYEREGKPQSDELIVKLRHIISDRDAYYAFLYKQDRVIPWRQDAERQARLEPERTKTANETLEEMGFEVKVISSNEINFQYKGATIKYFPYSGWASGKTITDGRGFKNLIAQLTVENND